MSTRDNSSSKRIWHNKHFWYIAALSVVCILLYHLPTIVGEISGTGASNTLDKLHNLEGIDVLGILFLAPIIYISYIYGIVPSIFSAVAIILIILPHTLLIDDPNAVFKPIAFVIILGGAGAIVAILRKREHERDTRFKEMTCLYDINRTGEESNDIPEFLGKVADLVPLAMPSPCKTGVRVSFRGTEYTSPGFFESTNKITEPLPMDQEDPGSLEIHTPNSKSSLEKKRDFLRIIAEKVTGTLRHMEVSNLKSTNDAENKEDVQEKLIRSERLTAVGELASSVGHELRNPLNVIRNCSYLLNMHLTEKDDEEALKSLQILDKQIDIANRIVTDLMDFTRLQPPSRQHIDLSSLVNESLANALVPENVTIKSSLNGSRLSVHVDAEQIGRVFTNVICNACQAMNGQGELDISTAIEEPYVWVSFRDNGGGISEENMAKIFEPLFTTKPTGFGLGLAISKRLVEQNDGEITADSQVNQGAIFRIKLPLAERKKG